METITHFTSYEKKRLQDNYIIPLFHRLICLGPLGPHSVTGVLRVVRHLRFLLYIIDIYTLHFSTFFNCLILKFSSYTSQFI